MMTQYVDTERKVINEVPKLNIVEEIETPKVEKSITNGRLDFLIDLMECVIERSSR